MRIFYLLTLFLQLFILQVHGAGATPSYQQETTTSLEVHSRRLPDAHVFVIFGGTGDLAKRKLIPALISLAEVGELPNNFVCVGIGRNDKTDVEFRHELSQALEQFAPSLLQTQAWNFLKERIFYFKGDVDNDRDYQRLKSYLSDLDVSCGTKGNRLFYLATAPSYFPVIIEKIHHHALVYEDQKEGQEWSRVIIEKPFGHDTQSAIELQEQIADHIAESQVYRIDHYLGKEVVQNLLLFRFKNSIFESLWNHQYIDNVRITLSEDIGVGTRGSFFEETGLLRDVVQNHMMQLLAIIAMEPPSSLLAGDVQEQKIKLLESIRPFPADSLDEYVVRGQYGPGYVNNLAVPGYRQEQNIAIESPVETFVAAKLFIDNERWKDVPMFLLAGKRLSKRFTEIVITFKNPSNSPLAQTPNSLVFRIQPDEEIYFTFCSQVPGLSGETGQMKMNFNYESLFGKNITEAYERLLHECMHGDHKAYVPFEELLASWRLWTPVLNDWQQHPPTDFPNYTAGSEGPIQADVLLNLKAD